MRSPWSREEGLQVAAELQKYLQPFGWEVGMAGSVLHKGKSDKDLDLLLFPRNTERASMSALRSALEQFGMNQEHNSLIVRQDWWRHHNSLDQKHVEVWSFQGKRIDLFFLR